MNAATATKPREFELQLGHLCNDRCVFCESGRLTHARRAPVLAAEMLERRVREAYAAGHRRITFLGGEPTIQPSFLAIVELAVRLGFESIVVFSNGSRAGSSDLVDRVLATGGNFEWRFSVQGATRDAHERTTGRKGGFDQVLRALATVRERGQRATVNLCLVRQNAATIDRFAELLLPLGVAQVHVDMLNPYDTGALGEDEVAAMMPRYTDVVPALDRMVHAFPAGFDVSLGGLPFCVAPSLARWIHHDHHPMTTVTASDVGASALKPARFLARTNRKQKPASCADCIFDGHCSGVFDFYVQRHGAGELRPVTRDAFDALDPRPGLVAVTLRPWLRDALVDLAPWVREASFEEINLREVVVLLQGDGGRELRLLFTGDRRDASAIAETCALRVQGHALDATEALQATSALWSRLEGVGMRSLVPPGADAFVPLEPSVGSRLRRLREAAPFGELAWVETRAEGAPARVEILLRSPDGETATVWLASDAGRATGGYRVDVATPSAALVDGLREVIAAVKRYQLP